MSAATEHDIELAVRVEAAVLRLDARLRSSESWRSAVAEWRDCVQRYGPGSSAAIGCLLALVRIAWGGSVIVRITMLGADAHVLALDSDCRELFCSPASGASKADVIVGALESAP